MNEEAAVTADARSARPVAGRVIDGRYRLTRKLGEGGMGEVWGADQLAPVTRPVAVKFLHARFAADSDAARRFVAEANITARLQHPGVPPVHHVGELPDGRPYLVMKLVSGQALDALLAADGPGAARWLAPFEGVCQAVGYAHGQGVVHRDLKPANVMVGAFGEVQVMDWGLARQMGSGESGVRNESGPSTPHSALHDPHSTRVGSTMGTPAYMAPEQAAGEWPRVDERADVFALGAVLCALLTGQPPYAGDPSVLHLRAVSGDTTEAFARLDRSGAEPELVALCKRCLAFEPDDRPANGAAVAAAVADLRRAAEERVRRAELDRARADVRAAEHRKRGRLALLGVGLLAVVLAAGVVGTAVGLLRAERARDAEAVVRVKAEDTRDRIRGFFDTVFDEVSADLLDDPHGLAEKRGKMNRRTLAVYRQLAAEEVTDEASRRRVAVALFRCGTIENWLSDRHAAEASFTAACREYEALLAARPDEAEYRRGLGDSLNSLGYELASTERKAEAEEHYRRGMAIRAALASEATAGPDGRAALGYSHHNLGMLLSKIGRPDEAAAELEKALAIRDRLAADPPTVRRVHELALTRLQLADLLVRTRKLPAADAHLRAALPVLEKHAALPALASDFRRDLADAQQTLGDLRVKQGKWSEAEDALRRSLAAREKLVADKAGDSEEPIKLVGTHVHLGDGYIQQNQPPAADRHYRAAWAVCETFPPDADDRHRTIVGSVAFMLGLIRATEKRHADAVPWYGRAIDAFAGLHAKGNAVARVHLRGAHEARAAANESLEKFADAVADWDAALAVSEAGERPALRASRAYALSRAGRLADALREADELVKAGGWTAEQWYNLACLYAVVAARTDGPKSPTADRAMDALARAVAAGWNDAAHLKADPDLIALHGRDDFKKLAADLKPPPKKD